MLPKENVSFYTLVDCFWCILGHPGIWLPFQKFLDFRLFLVHSQVPVPENAAPGNFCILQFHKLLLVHSEALLCTPLLKIIGGEEFVKGGECPP